MAVTILIPTALRQFTDGSAEVTVNASVVLEALNNLTSQYPDLKKHLFADTHKLRSFVNIYINEEDIRHKNGLDTQLSGNETIMLVPSIAGGW
jgi:molybdopterin converting factor small subunit